MEIVCWLALRCDDELYLESVEIAMLIVSVSLGNFALFRWRRQSCSSNEDSSGKLLVVLSFQMEGQVLLGQW